MGLKNESKLFLSMDWAMSSQFFCRAQGWKITPNGLDVDRCPLAWMRTCISSPKQDPIKKHDALLGSSSDGGMTTAVLSLGDWNSRLTTANQRLFIDFDPRGTGIVNNLVGYSLFLLV